MKMLVQIRADCGELHDVEAVPVPDMRSAYWILLVQESFGFEWLRDIVMLTCDWKERDQVSGWVDSLWFPLILLDFR